MKEIGIKEQKKETIIDILNREVYYKVPIFQREFSWKKDELSDLFEDLQKSMKNDTQHFFGFMMLRPEENNYVNIIEGQQRLASITIIICIIRDMLYELNDISHIKIETKYIKSDDTIWDDGGPSKYKLTLSEINKLYFTKYIQRLDFPKMKIDEMKNDRPPHPSNKLIQDAYKYYYYSISTITNPKEDRNKVKYLKDLLKIILKNLVLITTEVTDNKIAYNIFQTLNDRGLNLALADLLKVYLFDLADNDVHEAKSGWDEIINTLGNINLNNFLRHYWVSKYEVINIKDLMTQFESKIKTKADAFKFLDELKFEAEIYESIFNKSLDMWSQEVVDLIDELFILSKNMVLPILLGGLQSLRDQYHEQFLKTLISFIFRYLTIAERENKELELQFSRISKEMRKNKHLTNNDIKRRLDRMYVDDDTFKTIFMSKEIKTIKIAKYILQKIEFFLDPLQEKFSNKITLEHILPKNPNDDWEEYFKQENMDHASLINLVGNMTLLLGKVNKKAQNKFYTIKRDQFYKKMTSLKINEFLSKISSWNSNDIINRQKYFGDQAAKIWKL